MESAYARSNKPPYHPIGYGTPSQGPPAHQVDVRVSRRADLAALSRLPPLPEPDRVAMRQEACVGVSIVLGITSALVVVTHMSLRFGSLAGAPWWTFLFAIWAEALFALFCLAGILYGDAGVIQRSPETSFPLPEVVAERLQAGQPLEGLDNLTHAQLGSYCVRCCVWRPTPAPERTVPDDCDVSVCVHSAHHCRTCGRCVRDFDHHCGVFGRCIAGQFCSGNLHYFYGIIAMGWLGFATTMAAVLMSGVKIEHQGLQL